LTTINSTKFTILELIIDQKLTRRLILHLEWLREVRLNSGRHQALLFEKSSNIQDYQDDHRRGHEAGNPNIFQHAVGQSELQIWSLEISNLERIPACNCVLTFLEHHQSTRHG
jgi:hypothetical protein